MNQAPYTQKQLREQLLMQNIDGQKLYYSYTNKVNNIGLFKNQRMLIFYQSKSQLYYTDPGKAPFRIRQRIPISKKDKDIINVHRALLSLPANSTDLKIQFTKKTDQNKLVAAQWVLVMANKQLAKDWYNLIQKHKTQQLQNALGPNNNNKNVAFIHETINYAMLPEQKQINNVNNPRQSNIRQSQIKNSYIKKSQIRQQPNNNTSRISIQDPKIQPSIHGSKINDQRNINNTSRNNDKLQDNYSKNINSVYDYTQSRMKNSKIKPQINTSRINQNDWNFQFYRNMHQQIIIQFQQIAYKSFMNSLNQDRKSSNQQKIRIYQSNGLFVTIADTFTPQADQLKMEFRNYHFILESTKRQFIVGVPLCCLLEIQGIVGLVKAPIHQEAVLCQYSADIASQLKELERYTRIKNQILRANNCKIYDLGLVYSNPRQKNRILYIDQLKSYLPIQTQQTINRVFRPQFILDNINSLIVGGAPNQPRKNQLQISKSIQALVRSLANYLSNQQFIFANILELKNFLHINGLNLKYLPHLYKQISNKSVRKYIHTCMVTKCIKDNILSNLSQIRRIAKRKQSLQLIIQDIIRSYIQGGNINNSQRWKQISMRFKKQFHISLNSYQIVPGFFLNSLLCLLRVNYDTKKLNQNKNIFKQQGIINQGFILELLPKIKSYWRFTTQINDKISNILKYTPTQTQYKQIVQMLQLKTKNIPYYLSLNQNNKKILQYLSTFIKPQILTQSQGQYKHLKIYNNVNLQPPTQFSIKISQIYLQYAIKYNKYGQFKKCMEQSLRIIDYWFDQYHPYHCQFYDCLAQYYANTGNIQQSINISKQSLITCIKSGTKTNKLLGQKCYQLAQKQLKGGRKNDAMQNFIKAKSNMQHQNTKSDYYPLVLMNLALLNLNSGQLDKSIQFAIQAQKQFQNPKTPNQYQRQSIKTYQILGRAYQINSMKNQLRQMSLRCAQKFNRTNNKIIFQQMLRICTTGAITKLSLEKSRILLNCLKKIQQTQKKNYQEGFQYLMNIAQNQIVMQKFIYRIDSVQKVWTQISSKRAISNQSRQFLTILSYISSIIGQQFISGLVQQKEYE